MLVVPADRSRMFNEGFSAPLADEMREELRRRTMIGRRAVLTATSLADSGHPGGSFSSMELYTTLYSCAKIRADEPRWQGRDRIVVSHGHTSPGVYASLAQAGFFPIEQFEAHFRQAGSVFEGHVERAVPGVEWTTGNLGQGLSAGVGFALASRITKTRWHTYVVMSDGEQHKGQVAEARRLAVKEGLSDLTVLVDLNGIQISGRTSDVMPVDVASDFAADGWTVLEIDGHDIDAVHSAVREAHATAGPVAIVARTVIGKGVTFMENQPEFHGRALKTDEYAAALAELGLEPDIEAMRVLRAEPCTVDPLPVETPPLAVCAGEPREYAAGAAADNRSAWGAALADVTDENPGLPIAVLDCDLAVSVKTEAFSKRWPERFIQCGVGEHNAATVAGALSVSGVLAYWSDFGVFGVDEVYNQQRLNDINGAAVKLVVTHCGLDVGEDGRTHQCVDYIGAFRDFFGWAVIVPCDPNQTDRAVRVASAMAGNVCVAMGRSKLSSILATDGSPLFGGAYEFRCGDAVWARQGSEATIVATGTLAGAAVAAADLLRGRGADVGVLLTATPLALDDEAMTAAVATGTIVTVEDHTIGSGLGLSVATWCADRGAGAALLRLGVDGYADSGAADDLFAEAGLDADGIATAVEAKLGKTGAL